MAEPGGHHLNVLPLFHAGGLLCYSNPMLFRGGRLTTTKRFNSERTLDLLPHTILRSPTSAAICTFSDGPPGSLLVLRGLPQADSPRLARPAGSGRRPAPGNPPVDDRVGDGVAAPDVKVTKHPARSLAGSE